MLTGRRYLLAFTSEQSRDAEMSGAICRAVWNTGLEQRREYRRRGAWISYVEQARQMADAKKDPDCIWLSEAPSHILQQTLRDLDRACKTHGTWKVRWRSKAQSSPSFRFPVGERQKVERLNRRWAQVKLPKLGWVRFRWTRPLGGIIRNATVSRQAGRWYISFCVEDGAAKVAPSNLPPVGVDRGVKVAVATSDGGLFDRRSSTLGEQERLRRLQRRLSRSLRTHGRNRKSNRRHAARDELARLNARMRAKRTDFAAQTANTLVRKHGLVAVEDLHINNMTKSARGTVDKPGRNVRQKAGLNRAILNKGWGGFLLSLQKAARFTGTEIVKVNPAYTSQRCSRCGHVDAKSRESQASFACTGCGYRDNADVNAAKNILAAGLAVSGRGDLGTSRSMKRQPSAGEQRAIASLTEISCGCRRRGSQRPGERGGRQVRGVRAAHPHPTHQGELTVKLSDLIARLTEIEKDGFGDSRVIDDNGNDVMEAVRPVSPDEAVGADPDAAAVMLHCYIDHGHH